MAHIYLSYRHYKKFTNYMSTNGIFRLSIDIIYFGVLRSLVRRCQRPRVSTLIWHLPWRSRWFESGVTLHKSNEEHVHRQTKCHQSDHLPGFRSKTETSRNLAHICFLWRQRTKVMKSLIRYRGGEAWKEREKQQSRWFQLESYR